MASQAEVMGEASQPTEITFKVKASGGKTHTFTMPETATVLDLKTKLATEEFENVPVERQRTIYSGRVMKNEDALSVYKIKAGNTIHMVKGAGPQGATNPSSSANPTVPGAGVPQNMAAGTAANNLLAGWTGARFAGLAPLPDRQIFGADGGMGAPPSEDQIADMLSNPAIAQTMNEALNNPAFIDAILQQHPHLANMPNAREMFQSPYFRNMLTNPESLRAAARMRRAMAGQQSAFPAPGATDTTPSDAPAAGAASGSAEGANPFANLFGPLPPEILASMMGSPSSAGQSGTAAERSTDGAASAPAEGAAGTAGQTEVAAPANPFAALFGAGGSSGVSSNAGQQNANNPFGNITPEMMRQAMEFLGPRMGLGGGATSPPAPVDDRPPEERYAEQLRQLNEMGFFDFDRNVAALRRSGGSVQGAVEQLLQGL